MTLASLVLTLVTRQRLGELFIARNTARLRTRASRARPGAEATYQPPSMRPRTSNETRSRLKGYVRPKPVQCDYKPVTKPNQKPHMNETPEEPGERASQLYPSEVRDRRSSPDRRQFGPTAITKGRWLVSARESGLQETRYISALLFGYWSETWKRLAVLP
jgi:hypothetical protein